MIVWITGPSKSGKTTLAKKLQSKLNQWILLDGDEIRSISHDLGFAYTDRLANCKRIAKLAKILDGQGFNVLVSVIAPFQEIRDKVDEICQPKWVCLPIQREETTYDNTYEIPTNALIVDINEEDRIIDELKLFAVFVVGSRRSGTSLMVELLEKLGVKMFYDNDVKTLHDYKTFEIRKELMAKFFKIVTTPYTGCKILLPFDTLKLDIFKKVPCKIIFTWRDPEKISDSFEKHFGLEDIKRFIIKDDQLTQLKALESIDANVLIVDYDKLLANPIDEIKIIADFIHSEKDIKKASKLVKKPLVTLV